MIQKIKTLCKPYPHISTLPQLLWSPQIKEKIHRYFIASAHTLWLEKTHQQAILVTVET